MEKEDAIAFCEKLFAKYLDGHALMSNASHLRGSAQWIRFPRVVCQGWVHHNGRAPVVLMGDAAHTAHFSIGSGTKLALEDAIELARCIGKVAGGLPDSLPAALEAYEATRSIEVLKIQNAARNSTEWFEHVDRYVNLPPAQFAYSLLTRSQRISHENLRLRDKVYVEEYEDWIAEHAGVRRSPVQHSIPPMLTPFTLRGVTLKNRVVVSPMAQYSCIDGLPADYHLVHLGARAMGGAGMVVVEMTCPSPDARITPACPGLWNEAQRDGWKRIVDFVHANTDAKIAMQLGHAGAKGSTRVPWEGEDQPLASANWPLISASPQQYLDGISDWSHAMTRADMDRVRDDFVRATRYAAEAGFDWLELHCAHGYLLSSFISPLTNQRTDEYGGSLANRLRYPLEIFHAMREVWPQHLPISVRISAHDWVEGGITPDDAVEIARAFKAAGADLIDCSSARSARSSSRSTAACTRRRSPTASATRPASRRSRSARSPRPTTSTASSRRAVPTCARWPGRTSRTRPGRCSNRPRSATPTVALAEAIPLGEAPARTQSRARAHSGRARRRTVGARAGEPGARRLTRRT
jgi:anthraniloyl-CoA monooxygenase